MHKNAQEQRDASAQTRDPEQDSTCSHEPVSPDLLTVARAFLDSRKERGCKPRTLYGYEHAARMFDDE